MDWLGPILVDAGTGFWRLLDSLIPDPPAELVNACRVVDNFTQLIEAWFWMIPVGWLQSSVVLIAAVFAAAIVIRVARIGTSLMTGGGGA